MGNDDVIIFEKGMVAHKDLINNKNSKATLNWQSIRVAFTMYGGIHFDARKSRLYLSNK